MWFLECIQGLLLLFEITSSCFSTNSAKYRNDAHTHTYTDLHREVGFCGLRSIGCCVCSVNKPHEIKTGKRSLSANNATVLYRTRLYPQVYIITCYNKQLEKVGIGNTRKCQGRLKEAFMLKGSRVLQLLMTKE
jgi:hypothetical protein